MSNWPEGPHAIVHLDEHANGKITVEWQGKSRTTLVTREILESWVKTHNELIDRRAECKAWMNGVADAVEQFGYDREAACGPADLLPGLDQLLAALESARSTAVLLEATLEDWLP